MQNHWAFGKYNYFFFQLVSYIYIYIEIEQDCQSMIMLLKYVNKNLENQFLYILYINIHYRMKPIFDYQQLFSTWISLTSNRLEVVVKVVHNIQLPKSNRILKCQMIETCSPAVACPWYWLSNLLCSELLTTTIVDVIQSTA